MHTSVIQLTDCHLSAGDKSLQGQDTTKSLVAVTELIRDEHPLISLLLATGDVSHDGSLESYDTFCSLTEGLADRRFWVPGNHDEPDVMQHFDLEGSSGRVQADLGNWRILLLDSRVTGEIHGYLAEKQLEWLQGHLADILAENLLLVLHHHVEKVDSAWMDEWMLMNANPFFEMIQSSTKVRGILFGHVHQQIDYVKQGIRIMGTPASSVQFQPGSEKFALDDLKPGYRWLRLHQDGSIETDISRITEER